ncbi:MAG: hypothetical protein SFZ23_05610 [Planctomycetota bacterium]|nr:hypothetical protein [Planctomycetota bacterium]
MHRSSRPAGFAAGLAISAGLALSLGQLAQAQTTATWASPVSGSWGTAGNWNPPVVPNNNGPNTFNAVIAATGSPYTVTLNLPVTVSNFSLTSPDATLDLTTFRLNVLGATTIANSVARGLTPTAALETQGLLTLRGGTLLGIRNVNARGGVRFEDGFVANDVCDSDIRHGGVGSWTGTQNILFADGSNFTILRGSTFNITSAASLQRENMGGPLPVFRNEGTVTKNSSGETFFDGGRFENVGTISVQQGTLRTNGVTLTAGVLTGEAYNVGAGATLNLEGVSVLTNAATVRLQGAGATFAALSTLEVNGAVGATASLGRLELSSGATFTTQGNFQNLGGITIEDGASFAVAPGSAFTSVAGGTLTEGQLVVGGVFEADNLEITSIAGDVALTTGVAQLRNRTTGQSALEDLASVGAGGRFALENATSFSTTGGFLNQGTLEVDAGGTFRVAPGSVLGNVAGGSLDQGVFVIGGTLQADNAIAITSIGAEVTLDGAASDIVDGAGVSALTGLQEIEADGALALAGGRSFTTTGDFVVQNTGELGVGAGSLFRVAPGFNLANFAAGEFTFGTFNVQGTVQADNLQIQVIRNATITLDSLTANFLDGNGDDAFASLTTIDTQGRLFLRNGVSRTLGNALTITGAGSELFVGSGSALTAGAITVAPLGTLSLDGGTVETDDDDGVVIQGTLQGNGAINDSVVLDGIISPGANGRGAGSTGLLAIGADLTLDHSAVMVFDIGSPAEGSTELVNDIVAVLGNLIFNDPGDGLAGTIRLNLLPSFRPVGGTLYTLITFGEIEGGFENFEGFDLGQGRFFLPVQTRSTFGVVYVPTPGAFGVLAGGALLALRRRR